MDDCAHLRDENERLSDALREALDESQAYLKVAAESKDDNEYLRVQVAGLREELDKVDSVKHMLAAKVSFRERELKALVLTLRAQLIEEDADDRMAGIFTKWEVTKAQHLGSAPTRAARILEHYAKLMLTNCAPDWAT